MPCLQHHPEYGNPITVQYFVDRVRELR